MRISWIIGSYFLVAGGCVLSSLLLSLLRMSGTVESLLFNAGGAFVGGYLAAGASRGKTILEPAIGAVLFAGSLVGIFMLTSVGEQAVKLVFHGEASEVTKRLLITVGPFFGGGLVGAFIGEMLRGERRAGQGYMTIVSFFTVLGGIFIGIFAVMMIAIGRGEGLGIGLLLASMAAGSFLGGVVSAIAGARGSAVAGGGVLCGLLFVAFTLRSGGEAIGGGAIIAAGVILCAMIGGALGGTGRRAPSVKPSA